MAWKRVGTVSRASLGHFAKKKKKNQRLLTKSCRLSQFLQIALRAAGYIIVDTMLKNRPSFSVA